MFLLLFFFINFIYFQNNAKCNAKCIKQTGILSGYDTTKEENFDFETFFITVCDTSNNYYTLQNEMFDIGKYTKIKIDMMGRYYNKKKHEIVLPDNDEDEIYRGEYYPRRDTSEFLSLEYFFVYKEPTGKKNIALIAGIYETKRSADSLLKIIEPYAKNPFVIKSKVYVGCMH